MSDDDLQERMARRFDNEEEGAKNEQSNKNTQTDKNNMNAESTTRNSEQNAKNAQSAWNAQNVKQDWRAIQAYLPDELYDQWDDEFDRIRYLSEENWQKDRDYKPLVFYLALQQLQDMDGSEIDALREQMQNDI